MGVSAWAEAGDVITNANIDFSNAITDGVVTGTVNSMAMSTDSHTEIADGILVIGSGTNTVSIPEAQRANTKDVVKITFEMGMGKWDKMYTGFRLKDEDGSNIGYLRYGKYNGVCETNLDITAADFKEYNTVLWPRRTYITITLDYAAKTITTETLWYDDDSQSSSKKQEHSHVVALSNTNPLASFEVFGEHGNSNAWDRRCKFDNLVITTTLGDYTSPSADYTVNWICNGETVKTETRNGDVDAAIELTAVDKGAFWVSTQKYYYVSDDLGSKTVAEDGSTVVNITVREANTWTATIKAVDGDDNEIGDVKTATGIEGESLTLAHSVAAKIGDVWYETTRINDYRHTLNEASPSVNVTYTPSDRISFFFDNEDYTIVSKRDDGYLPERGASSFDAVRVGPNGYLYTPELTAGVYNLTVNTNNSNSGEASLSIELLNGDEKTSTEMSVTQAQNSYYTESTVEGIIVPADGYRLQLANNTTWNSNMSVDYMILTLVRPINVAPSVTDYATFSSEYPLNFATATGVNAYYASASDGSVVSMTKVTGAVAAGTGLLLQKTEGEISIPTAATGDDLSATNLLKPGKGEEVKTEGNTHRYVLAGEGDATSFYELTTGYVVPEGKAYLEVANAGARLMISFNDGEATGISALEQTNAEVEAIYNLNGQRVMNPVKGLYIVNGKKVIKK